MDEIFPPKEFFTMVMGMTEEDTEVVIKAAEKYMPKDLEEDGLEDEDDDDEDGDGGGDDT